MHFAPAAAVGMHLTSGSCLARSSQEARRGIGRPPQAEGAAG